MDWSEIFGFLVFLAIGGFGVLHKMYEERQLEQRRKERKESRPEDLPEATRRMLYGENADPRTFSPPVAKPRTARPLSTGPAPLPPLAQPRAIPPRRMTAPPQRAPVTAEVDEAERKAGWEVERVPDENAPSRETAPPPTPALQQQREQVQRTMQQAWQQAQKRKQQAEAQVMQARRKPQGPPRSHTTVPPAPPERASRQATAQGALRAAGPDLRLLRMDHRTLVQGILLQEVLGPPRALRPYGE